MTPDPQRPRTGSAFSSAPPAKLRDTREPSAPLRATYALPCPAGTLPRCRGHQRVLLGRRRWVHAVGAQRPRISAGQRAAGARPQPRRAGGGTLGGEPGGAEPGALGTAGGQSCSARSARLRGWSCPSPFISGHVHNLSKLNPAWGLPGAIWAALLYTRRWRKEGKSFPSSPKLESEATTSLVTN